jgi:PHD/YefM family antitoxin component YafN of YafNO toxin-antitoxin module
MRANAFPRNSIAKSALSGGGNPYGYAGTRRENVRAAVRQANAAGVPVRISRQRNPAAMAIYSAADKAITVYARSSGWTDRSATARARRRSNFASSSRPEGLMVHEIAHAKSKTLLSGENWQAVAQRANVKLDRGWDQMKPVRRIANRVSAYAREHPQEFIAEYRAARASGRRFDSEVAGLYRAAAGIKGPAARVRRRR